MVLTFEQYQGMTPAQKKQVKKAELQQLIDEHLDNDTASIRGIIRDELKAQIDALEKKISAKYNKRIKDVEDENERLKKENTEIKSAIGEQQKFLERVRGEQCANNIFISGLPNEMELEGEQVADANVIISHVLSFLSPGIQPNEYKVLKSFEPREGHDRHSAKIQCSERSIKGKIFKGCIKFKDVPAESPIKPIKRCS